MDSLHVLSDPVRLAIVESLASRPTTVAALAEQFPISRPAVSRHLRLLKEAGLVVEEARGTARIYRLHDEGVAAVQEYLARVWGDVATRMRLFAENTRPPADPPRPAPPGGAT